MIQSCILSGSAPSSTTAGPDICVCVCMALLHHHHHHQLKVLCFHIFLFTSRQANQIISASISSLITTITIIIIVSVYTRTFIKIKNHSVIFTCSDYSPASLLLASNQRGGRRGRGGVKGRWGGAVKSSQTRCNQEALSSQ